MVFYQFAIWKGGTRMADLGDVPLPNDIQAFAFANRVIREYLTHSDATKYTGCTIDITEDKRAVGGVRFKVEVADGQTKH